MFKLKRITLIIFNIYLLCKKKLEEYDSYFYIYFLDKQNKHINKIVLIFIMLWK